MSRMSIDYENDETHKKLKAMGIWMGKTLKQLVKQAVCEFVEKHGKNINISVDR